MYPYSNPLIVCDNDMLGLVSPVSHSISKQYYYVNSMSP